MSRKLTISEALEYLQQLSEDESENCNDEEFLSSDDEFVVSNAEKASSDSEDNLSDSCKIPACGSKENVSTDTECKQSSKQGFSNKRKNIIGP